MCFNFVCFFLLFFCSLCFNMFAFSFVCVCCCLFVISLNACVLLLCSPPIYIYDLQIKQESIIAEIVIYCIESATTVIKNKLKTALANQSVDPVFGPSILLYPGKYQSLVQKISTNVARQSDGNTCRRQPTKAKKNNGRSKWDLSINTCVNSKLISSLIVFAEHVMPEF